MKRVKKTDTFRSPRTGVDDDPYKNDDPEMRPPLHLRYQPRGTISVSKNAKMGPTPVEAVDRTIGTVVLL